MIQSLRKTHRRLFLALALLLPTLFVSGLVYRHKPLASPKSNRTAMETVPSEARP